LEDQNLLALIVSVFSFIVSAISIFIVRHFNKVALRNSTKQEHARTLFDINKLLISDPELWAIYDKHEITQVIVKDIRNKSKRQALIYLYINFFDTVFNFYNKQIKKDPNDQREWEAWVKFMDHFFKDSIEARQTFQSAYTWYPKDFAKFINQLIHKMEKDPAVDTDTPSRSK
jgi:hypothetical protein